jgi:hypothetical protein
MLYFCCNLEATLLAFVCRELRDIEYNFSQHQAGQGAYCRHMRADVLEQQW